MTFNNNNFTIKDDSSQFVRFLPEKYIEPLVIIAKIKGYDGIDDYILNLIKDSLEMFADTRDGLDDDFQKYMHNRMIGKYVVKNLCCLTPTKKKYNESSSSSEESEEEDNNNNNKEDSK